MPSSWCCGTRTRSFARQINRVRYQPADRQKVENVNQIEHGINAAADANRIRDEIAPVDRTRRRDYTP